MKNFWKNSGIVVGILILNAISVFAFSDVSSTNTYYEAISFVEEEGLVDGYPDGSFQPFAEINRAEFTKIIVGTIMDSPGGNDCFDDVSAQWFAPYVCYAREEGIVDGYPDGLFHPEREINLVEGLKIIFETLDLGVYEGEVEEWYEPYLLAAMDDGYLENVESAAGHELLRGEMAQIIFNILGEKDTSGEVIDENVSTASLYDNEYDYLPPGNWDWDDSNNDLANWRNFEGNIGHFEEIYDSSGAHIGWRLIGNNPSGIDYAGAAAYFEGSSGIDILDLGLNGKIHSFTNGNLGDGPDILVFDESWTLDFRTGSSLSGNINDADLVIAGCNVNTDSAFDIDTTTIHTGPDEDLIFVRDMERAAIDAGNGDGGITSILDPLDGDDEVSFRGNMADFRFFGGNGNDTVFWYVDEVNQNQAWLYPNFFGGGGSGDAIWGDNGTDRLVLVIDPDTEIISQTPTGQGQLLVRIDYNYPDEIEWDTPVYDDEYARYCIRCGESGAGEKTLTLEYNSPDGSVFTGYFYVTDFEELQLGLGAEAKVYRLDDLNGEAILEESLSGVNGVEMPAGYCE